MSSRFATRLGLVAALAGAGAGLAGCKQDVHFTKAPVYGPAPPAPPRREVSAIAVATLVDLLPAARAADTALPQTFSHIVDWATNAACARRTRWVECNGARIDIDLHRNGAAKVTVAGGVVLVEIPLRYEAVTRGLGWAREIAETRKGELTGSIAIEARLGDTYEPDVRVREEVRLSEATMPALKARIGLAQHVGPRLRRAAQPIADAVRKQLAEARVKADAERAWALLHTPIELNRDAQVWLRAEPERVHAAGFVQQGDDIEFRTVVVSRVSTFTGQRPAPLLPKPFPVPSREAPAEARTRIQLPAVIGYEAMLASVQQAFPAGEVLRTSDVPDAPPLAVRVRGAALHPARGLLGMELQLEVAEPGQWNGLMGTAHFVGRPVFRAQSGLLELESVSFPDRAPPRQRLPSGHVPTSERDRNVNKAIEPTRGLRIGLEPFAGRLSKAARVDVSRLLRDVLPHVNSLLGQPVGDDLLLTGRFEEAKVVGVAPTRDGFEITFELVGQLTISSPPRAAANLAATVRPATD